VRWCLAKQSVAWVSMPLDSRQEDTCR
jgi:hypothetical protein